MKRQYGIKNLMGIIAAMTAGFGGNNVFEYKKRPDGPKLNAPNNWGSNYAPSQTRDKLSVLSIAEIKRKAQARRDRKNEHRLKCVAMGGSHYHA